MSLKSKSSICTYCGQEKPLGDDHVPPQSVIGFDHNLVVPSCICCNSGASKDDEYFQFAVSMAAATDSHPNISKIRERVFRGLGKEEARKYRDLIIRNIEISGEIEEDHKFSNYMERIKSVSERITRGLYYIEKNKNRLPSYYEVTTYIGNEYAAYGTENTRNFQALFRPLLDTEVHTLGDPPVFEYHFADIDDSDPCATVWYFKYFDGYELFALTLPKGDPRQLSTHFPPIHNMHLLPHLATLTVPACAELSDWLREQLGEPIESQTRTKTQASIGVTPILHGRLGKYSDSKD